MKKEELKPESLEEQVEQVNKSLFNLLDMLLPPKEVREEVKKNIYMAEVSLLKAFKTLLDYKVSQLERKVEGKPAKKERIKKIEVE